MWSSIVVGQAQKCLALQVEEPVGPRVVVAASGYPTDTRDRLDRRNQGTEGVAATDREGDNPMVVARLAFAVDFRQAVDPTYNPTRRSEPRWLHYRRSRTDLGREGAEQRR